MESNGLDLIHESYEDTLLCPLLGGKILTHGYKIQGHLETLDHDVGLIVGCPITWFAFKNKFCCNGKNDDGNGMKGVCPL